MPHILLLLEYNTFRLIYGTCLFKSLIISFEIKRETPLRRDCSRVLKSYVVLFSQDKELIPVSKTMEKSKSHYLRVFSVLDDVQCLLY